MSSKLCVLDHHWDKVKLELLTEDSLPDTDTGLTCMKESDKLANHPKTPKPWRPSIMQGVRG